MKSFFLIFVCLTAHAPRCSAETNKLFVTLNGPGNYLQVFAKSPDGGLVINPKRVEQAKKDPDSRPANLFPEGNWGEEVEGVQISLRLNKVTYTNDEPIIATVLLRNTADRNLDLDVCWVIGKGSPIDFVVKTDLGTPVRPKLNSLNASTRGERLPAGTQLKYYEDIRWGYALTNGAFTVIAEKSVPGTGGKRYVVKSAPVAINVVITINSEK